MASQLYDPQTDWRGCVSARVIPLDTITNPDMDGVIVGFAIVVVNFCLRIRMAFPHEEIGTQALAAISQLYFILLSTFFSIGRQQLSLFDANYALMATSSPFTIYLVFSSIRHLLGFQVGLAGRIGPHRRITPSSGVLLLPLWLGLRLTLRLSNKAFKDSELCSNPTFKDLLFDLLLLIIPLVGPVGGTWAILPSSIIGFLFLGIVGLLAVVVDSLAHHEGVPRLRVALHETYTRIRNIDREPVIWLLMMMLDFSWATSLITSAFLASGKEYVVSYGQLLTLFTVLLPLMSTNKLIYGDPRRVSALIILYIFFSLVVGFFSEILDNASRCMCSRDQWSLCQK